MAARKKEAAGIAPAAATEQAALVIQAPQDGPEPQDGAEQITGALGGVTLEGVDEKVLEGTVNSTMLPDGYPADIELGGRTVMVQARSARGRWRIGRHFTTTPSPVAIDELTEDEVGRLLADPELIVSFDD